LATAAVAINISTPDPNAVNVQCTTTKGNFSLVINPSWAPLGASRFLDMVDSGFFDRIAAYRVVPGFLVQFGIPFNKSQVWPDIPDDPNVGVQYPLFKRGMIAFAGYAPNTRGTEAFIAYQDSANLGRSAWGNPFGIVTSGMDVLDNFYSGYGDLTQFGGKAPDPIRLARDGGSFLLTEYPKLDYITSCARTSSPPASSSIGGSSGMGPRQALGTCTSTFCGSGIGFGGAAVCLCHENCLLPSSDLPCCNNFQVACPANYALGSATTAPTPKAAASKAKNAKKTKKAVGAGTP